MKTTQGPKGSRKKLTTYLLQRTHSKENELEKQLLTPLRYYTLLPYDKNIPLSCTTKCNYMNKESIKWKEKKCPLTPYLHP